MSFNLKHSWLNSPGLKSSWLKRLGLKSSFWLWGWKVQGWKVHGWRVHGWKVWGWSLGLKSPGLKCPSTLQNSQSHLFQEFLKNYDPNYLENYWIILYKKSDGFGILWEFWSEVKLGKMKILSVPSTLFFWLEIHGRNENKIILKIYIKSRGILKIISA